MSALIRVPGENVKSGEHHEWSRSQHAEGARISANQRLRELYDLREMWQWTLVNLGTTVGFFTV